MSHEQSVTKKNKSGKYGNYSGVTGKPLTPIFPYEQDEYLDISAAVAAAERRSLDFGLLVEEAMKRENINTDFDKSVKNPRFPY